MFNKKYIFNFQIVDFPAFSGEGKRVALLTIH